jgi:ABC-type phosphate/phosphonate transport system substrate-binding protein
MIEGAKALVAALAARLGRPVRLKLLEDYAEVLSATTSGAMDLAWMPPLVHVDAVDAGARLLAVPDRGGVLTYRAALLVSATSKIGEPKQLRGARFAWTDRVSAGGHLYPKMLLAAHGVKPIPVNEKFVGSARAACAAVSDGLADCCSCFVSEGSHTSPTKMLADVARVFPAAPWRLRVLDVTESIPPDGIVVGRHVDKTERTELLTALLALNDDSAGLDAIQKLLFAERLVRPNLAVQRAIARLRQLRGELRAVG